MNAVDYSACHKILVDCSAVKKPDKLSSEVTGREHDDGYVRCAVPLAVPVFHVDRNDNKLDTSSERGKINQSNKLLEERRLPCPVCGTIFVAMKNLESHLKSHTKHRPYQCLDCGKCFSLRHTLLCHTRVHTKERPYACSQCFKSFTQASTLKSHIIYKHTKQFPHKCNICGRGFVSPGQKMEHMTRLHSPEANVANQQ